MLSAVRRWPRTVRGRVVIAAVLATGLLLLVAGLAALELQERSLRDRLEQDLTARAGNVAALATAGQLPLQLSGAGEHSGTQVIDAAGNVVVATPDATSSPFSNEQPAPGTSITIETSGVLEEGHTGLLVAVGVATADGTYTVMAAEDLEEVENSLRVLRRTLSLGLPLLLLAVGVITALAVGRALRPVERARAQLAEISSSNLDQRIDIPVTDDEISRLSTTMNQLLDRVEGAYRREQQFVADASHELRNPIATLRSSLELGDLADIDRANLPSEVVRLENLVDDLLHIARRDGADPPSVALVDLDDILLEEVARASVAGVVLDASEVSAAQLRGVRGDLIRLVRNLLDNAVRHADGRIRISLAEAVDQVELVIDDDGPGIPVDQRSAVFERFARVDSDRSRQGGGTGLGLAIVRAIVDSHGGSIEIGDSPLGGARFRVLLGDSEDEGPEEDDVVSLAVRES